MTTCPAVVIRQVCVGDAVWTPEGYGTVIGRETIRNFRVKLIVQPDHAKVTKDGIPVVWAFFVEQVALLESMTEVVNETSTAV